MSTPLKILVGLALTLPLLAYAVGVMASAPSGPPTPEPVVVEETSRTPDPETRPSRRPSPRPSEKPPATRRDDDSDDGPAGAGDDDSDDRVQVVPRQPRTVGDDDNDRDSDDDDDGGDGDGDEGGDD